MIRLKDNLWTGRVIALRPYEGCKVRWRPERCLLDDLVVTAGKDWISRAQNRDFWRTLEKVYNRNQKMSAGWRRDIFIVGIWVYSIVGTIVPSNVITIRIFT